MTDTAQLTVPEEVETGVKDLVAYAETLDIQTVEDASDAGIKIFQISDLKQKIEDQRTEFTKPINLSLKSINAFFKRFSEPLDIVDKQIRAKVVEFGKTSDQTSFGVVHLKKNTVIEVTDVAKVPRSYLQPNMSKIKQAVKDGKEIPGVSVTIEKSVSL